MFELKDKDEAYAVIREALYRLGRSDEPRSYGIAPHPETGHPTLYFDLFRISPLQFNVDVSPLPTRQEMIERVRLEIQRRIEISESATLFDPVEQKGRKKNSS